MSEEAKICGQYLAWAMQDVFAMAIEADRSGRDFDESAAIEAIAKRTGLPAEELRSALTPPTKDMSND